MMNITFRRLTASLLLLCTLPAIVHADKRLDDDTTRPLLKQLVEKAILPTYDALDQQAQVLVTDVDSLCSQPTADNLEKVRAAWSATLTGWQKNSALLFGPAVENEIDLTIYFHPVKKAVINGLLSEKEASPEKVAEIGIGGQGLATLEYLLFDREKSTHDILALFDKNTGQQRCNYLQTATALLAKNLNTIHHSWTNDGGQYGKGFYTAGKGSAYFLETYQPLELLVNRMYQAIQYVEIKQLGVPLGENSSRKSKQRTYPYKLEAWRSGHSWQNIIGNLQGLQQLLEAGGILDTLRNNGDEKLAQQISTELKSLLDTQLPSNDLFQVLDNDPDSVKPFYRQVQRFAKTIRTGLAPALGIQLGFNQNDGD